MEIAPKNKVQIENGAEVSPHENTFLLHGTRQVPVRLEYASKYSLFFQYLGNNSDNDSEEPVNLLLKNNGNSVELGPCRILKSHSLNGYSGRLVFIRDVYDIRSLFEDNKVVKLQSPFHDLPRIFARKENLKPAFKAYVSDLKYDLQVYKSLFDDLDSKYCQEPEDVRSAVEKAIIDTEGRDFTRFFSDKLDELTGLVDDFSMEEHQRHGYYFSKQLWNLILCCPFSCRSTLKPRGYSGDSGLMRMICANDYQGESTYAKLTHKHGVGHAAGQSVRNRLLLVGRMLNDYQNRHQVLDRGKVKTLSVGCGPAFELKNIIKSPQDCGKYHFTLFDQDPVALSEANETVENIENTVGLAPAVNYVQGSVKTMLFSRKLRQEWGQFDFIYSLGLFDYLAPRVAKAVLDRLYQLLSPGAEMVIGNYHVSNPSRYYMGYWGDWFLIHRTEEEFRGLFRNNSKDKVSLSYDETGSQMFLHIQKQVDG